MAKPMKNTGTICSPSHCWVVKRVGIRSFLLQKTSAIETTAFTGRCTLVRTHRARQSESTAGETYYTEFSPVRGNLSSIEFAPVRFLVR
jgi:hypothetical protein